jgi:hypothetical protein
MSWASITASAKAHTVAAPKRRTSRKCFNKELAIVFSAHRR